MLDRRFPTALQVMQSLVLLERDGTNCVSSAAFASYFKINPTLMRRLLGTLVQHGLLQSTMGRNGGVRLAKAPEEITLRDVYSAAVAEKKLWTPRTDIPQVCVVSRNFHAYFDCLEAEADAKLTEHLGGKTLADSMADLERRDLAKRSNYRAEADTDIVQAKELPQT